MIASLIENRNAHVKNIKAQFQKIFMHLKKDDSDYLDLEMFEEFLDDHSVSGFFALLDIDASDAFSLFKLLDGDGSGSIDASEFVEGCMRIGGTARRIDMAEVKHESRKQLKEIQDRILV